MDKLFVGLGEQPVYMLPRYANRHGMIAGATGTGKSVSLMVLAEGFSRLGVPVFLTDIKGDLAGLSQSGTASEKMQSRVERLGIDWEPEGNPAVFWDIYGKLGHPVRTTISEMGPRLLARLMELNQTQEGVLEIIFRAADEAGLLLLDIKDLRAMLSYASDNSKALSRDYGLISKASIGAIQRRVLSLESSGGAAFFGEPALDLADFMRQDLSGRGIINILASEQLVLKPRIYSTFLLWMLSELFEKLPEVGDLDKPRLIFFFDEAHLLFNDAPPALLQRVEQVVRLIRSKGVGVYFCSQNPDDLPPVILGQMGSRIQHALRAFTPRDQKAVRAAAQTFAPNPKIKVEQAITELAVGEALLSTLQDGGIPLPVERALMSSPRSRMGTITDEERTMVRERSPVSSKYDQMIDRESAYEILNQRAEEAEVDAPPADPAPGKGAPAEAGGGGMMESVRNVIFGTRRRQGLIETMSKTAARNVSNQVSRAIMRGVLGSMSGKR